MAKPIDLTVTREDWDKGKHRAQGTKLVSNCVIAQALMREGYKEPVVGVSVTSAKRFRWKVIPLRDSYVLDGAGRALREAFDGERWGYPHRFPVRIRLNPI